MDTASFNFEKAFRINPSPFKAFDAGDKLELLKTALENQTVHANQPLLIAERPSGMLALDRQELSYHHVAQGDMHGEPWLVAF